MAVCSQAPRLSPPQLTPTPSITPTPSLTPTPTTLPGPCADIDGDDLVRISDVLYVIDRYFTSDLTADLDGDGLVNITDILIALAQYGIVCPA
jgi:hypothetical protein